ncbi:MAG: TonB-dependent receptor [Burkholderiales bacterium]
MRSNRPSNVNTRTLLSVFVASTLASGAAFAQQATKPDPKKDDDKLETIVVTATKRSESLQSVPVAVSVVSGDDLEKANLNNLTNIVQQLPTVNYRANASNKDTALFIRGVGTISTSPGVEPTVSTVVDGVVFARPGMATLDLMEVERLEVLRGPQGTLFGKNASAGVINIVSKAIPKATEGYVDFGYYDKKETRLRAGVAGPLGEGTGGSIAVFSGKYDGNVKNVFLNENVSGYDRKGVRGKLEFTPSRDVKINLIADYATADDTGTRGPFVRTSTAALTAAVLPVVAGFENRDVATNVRERVEDTNSGVSGQADIKFASGTLTSITAFRQWKNTQFQDLDGLNTVYNQLVGQADRGQLDSKQTSQEFRWASNKGGFIDYVAGFFYFNNKTDEVYRRDVTRCATTGANLANGLTPCATFLSDNGVATYGTDLKSTSFFGESNWNFAKDFRGILGLRYTTDDLSYYHGRVSTQPAAIPGVQPTRTPVSGSTKQNGVSGRIGPQWDLSKEVSVYATYSKGYKGPAYNAFFNMLPTADIALSPEKSKGYELGLKSTLADNRLRFNVAVFDTKYNGYQANYPDVVAGTIVTRFINAGDVSTKGVELDMEAKLSRELSIAAAYADTKAVVERFNCPVGATCTIPSGTMLPSAPRQKGVLRANYRTDMAGYLVAFSTDYTWQSETQFDLSTSPNTLQPSYGIWNASVSVASTASGWRVTLVGKNLADKSYSQFLLPGANTQRSVPRDDKRYYGVNVRYEF